MSGGPGNRFLAATASVGQGVGSDAPVAPSVRLTTADLPEWPSVVLHASISIKGVSVAIRDATITDDDAQLLFHRLRDRLLAAGHDLFSLVVNGREVRPESSNHASA